MLGLDTAPFLKLRQDTMKTLYDVLGVSKDASENTIKTAFRKIAMDNHPDRVGDDPEAAWRFSEATAAYETLGDLKARAEYDAEKDHVPDTLSDLLTSRLGLRLLRSRAKMPPLAPKPGMDLYAVVEISHMEPGAQVEETLTIRERLPDGTFADRPIVIDLTIPESWTDQVCVVLEGEGGRSHSGHGHDEPDGNLLIFLVEANS